MNIKQKFNEWLEGIKEYFRTEAELVKLKIVREVSKAMADVFSFLFILIFSIIVMAMAYIWLGFWLSSILDSFPLGFGIALASAAIQLLLMIKFRKQLLAKPFTDKAVKHILEEHEILNETDEDENQK